MHRRDFLRTTVGAISGMAISSLCHGAETVTQDGQPSWTRDYEQTLAASTDIDWLGTSITENEANFLSNFIVEIYRSKAGTSCDWLNTNGIPHPGISPFWDEFHKTRPGFFKDFPKLPDYIENSPIPWASKEEFFARRKEFGELPSGS